MVKYYTNQFLKVGMCIYDIILTPQKKLPNGVKPHQLVLIYDMKPHHTKQLYVNQE